MRRNTDGGGGRRPLAAALFRAGPTVVFVLDAERLCWTCGRERNYVGYFETVRLKHVPRRVDVQVEKREMLGAIPCRKA